MMNCEGCYYEDRPPQEACNLCSRGEDGHMTGWVSREKAETAMSDATVSRVTPHPSPAVTPSPQGEGFAASDVSMEEILLMRIEEKQEQLEQLREENHLKQLLIEEHRKQIDAWREEIDVLRGEREDLRIMLEKAKAEANYYKECLANETRLRELAYAKLDMVHLIFGGGNNA